MRVSISVASLVAVLLLGSPVAALADRVELGGFVGYNAPFEQDDTSDDIMVGASARVPLGTILKLDTKLTYFDMDREPYLVRNVPQEVSPWHMISGMLNLTLGSGFGRGGYHPYVTAGVGYYFLRKDEAPNENDLGFNAGVGLVMLMKPDISLDVSGRAERISLEDGGSRGMLNLRFALHYHLGNP